MQERFCCNCRWKILAACRLVPSCKESYWSGASRVQYLPNSQIGSLLKIQIWDKIEQMCSWGRVVSTCRSKGDDCSEVARTSAGNCELRMEDTNINKVPFSCVTKRVCSIQHCCQVSRDDSLLSLESYDKCWHLSQRSRVRRKWVPVLQLRNYGLLIMKHPCAIWLPLDFPRVVYRVL